MNTKMRLVTFGFFSIIFLGINTTLYADDSDTQQSSANGVDLTQDQYNSMMRIVNRNSPYSNALGYAWGDDKLEVHGLLNVDAKYQNESNSDQVSPQFNDSSYSTNINVNNANVLLDANPGHYLHAHVDFLYRDNVNYYQVQGDPSQLTLEEGYVTLQNFAQMPFYLKVGQAFVPFGSYENTHPIIYSLSQLMSEVHGPLLQGGMVTNQGVYFSAYYLNGNSSREYATNSKRVHNYGADVGIKNDYAGNTYQVGASYIFDLADLDFAGEGSVILPPGSHYDAAQGVSYYASVDTDLVSLAVNYMKALNSLVKNDNYAISAYDVTAGYSFPVYGKRTTLKLSYQHSSDAPLMPRSRVQVSYNLTAFKYAVFGVSYAYDRSYDRPPTDGRRVDTIGLRVGAQF